MLDDFWRDLVVWWIALSPEFVFLFALPFAVAGAAFLADAVRSRQHRRERAAARLAGRTVQP